MDVVVVGQRGAYRVRADGAIVHEEADLPDAERHGVQQVSQAAGQEEAAHPQQVVPEGVEEGVGGVGSALPAKHLLEVEEEDEDGQEVRPEVARLVGGSEGRGQALAQAVVGEAVAREDEVLGDAWRHVRVAEQRQGEHG